MAKLNLNTILIVAVLFTSCEVLKTKKSVKTDSVSVSKIDSGRVISTASERKDSFEWWRVMLDYTGKKDTNINNYYTTNPEPKVVVIEGGRGGGTTIINQVDSSWKQRYDSLAVQKTESSKTKETKVLSMWQIIGLCAGVCLIMILLSKLKIGLR